MPRANRNGKISTANLGFEAKLLLAADKLRSNMDAAEYKHVVLGLIFLKYISDAFEEHHAKLTAGKGEYAGADPEDPDEYKALNVFWVPPGARWTYLQNSAKQPEIGKIVDDAMVAIERDNPRLKGVLPKEYARPALDKHRLGELIDLIGATLLNVLTPGFLVMVGSALRANKEAFQWLSIACVGVLVFSLRWGHEILVPKHEHATMLAEWPQFYMIKNRTLVGVCYIIAGTCVVLTVWIFGIDLRAPKIAAAYCAAVAIVMIAALTLWSASIQIGIRLRRIRDHT